MPGFSLNGVAVGQDYSQLRRELLSGVSEQVGDDGKRALLDAESGASVAIDVDSSGTVWRVRAGPKSTLMRDRVPVCSLGDPITVLSNFPWPKRSSNQSEANNLTVYEDKARPQCLVVLGPEHIHGLELVAAGRLASGTICPFNAVEAGRHVAADVRVSLCDCQTERSLVQH